MPGYISEIQFYGDTSQEFVEVALPAGTDPSGYSIQIYMSDGTIYTSFPIGASTGTMNGQDVYVIDNSTPGFDDGGNDPTGNFYPDDGIALVDGSGNAVQFISYLGNTVTATEGPAAGMTSTNIGSAGQNQSMQSDNGGQNYYAQSSPNSGSIPACYGPGSMIATPDGAKPVEALTIGDHILTAGGRVSVVRWVWRGDIPLGHLPQVQKPVLIRRGAIGPGKPSRDLIVSGQHRIVVGAHGQLEDHFGAPVMVPAKALTRLPGIRFMAGKSDIEWHHFLCDRHEVAVVNGVASESLLLGPMILRSLSRADLTRVSRNLGRRVTIATTDTPTLPCLTVGQTRRVLQNPAKPEAA